MLFGKNPQTALLLAVIGLRENDVERFRDVSVADGGRRIEVYTRTGGGNRDSYPQEIMRARPEWIDSEDDDYDSTYCTDTFNVPEEWVQDVSKLDDIIGNGLRPEFGAHLVKTLRREPSEGDKAAAAYEAERAAIRGTKHFMANGHTFVPQDDSAMQKALELAEANGGSLRSCWGILPLQLTVKRDFHPYPKATDERYRAYFNRLDVSYDWVIDEPYWKHCQERWATAFPLTMASIAESVERNLKKAA
jgi:hypothetical protein